MIADSSLATSVYGPRTGRRAPTYVYRFDHASPLFRLNRIGAMHGTELPYVFGNFGVIPEGPTHKLSGRRDAEKVARRLQQRWIDFAHGREPWTLYDEVSTVFERLTAHVLG